MRRRRRRKRRAGPQPLDDVVQRGLEDLVSGLRGDDFECVDDRDAGSDEHAELPAEVHQLARLDLLLGDLVLEDAALRRHFDRQEIALRQPRVHVDQRRGVLDSGDPSAVERQRRELKLRHRRAFRPTGRKSCG